MANVDMEVERQASTKSQMLGGAGAAAGVPQQKKLPAWLRDAIMKQETDKAKEKRKQLSDTAETKKVKMPSYTKFDGDSDAQSTESETEETEPDLGTAPAPQLDDATRTQLVRTIFTEVLLDVTKQLTQLVATQVLVSVVVKTQAAKATDAAAPKKEAEKRPLGGLVGYGSSSEDESDQSSAEESNSAGRDGQPPSKERRRK